MSGSINETGSSQQIDAERVNPAIEATLSGSAVDAGFSRSNSFSYVGNVDGSSTTDGDWVALDAPSGELMGSKGYLEKVFSTRMESLRSIFTDFNARFASGHFDLSDTQTLLMVFRGLIQDIKLLNKAEKVDEVSFNRSKNQETRLEVADLIISIAQSQKEIDQKKEDLPLKLQEAGEVKQAFIQKAVKLVSSSDSSKLQDKDVEDAVKQLVSMIEFEPSDFAREMANSLWKGEALANELVGMQLRYKGLLSEINQLRELVSTLEADNLIDKTRLAALLLYLALHVHEDVVVKATAP
ncbi:MAG: hypothetical protein ACPG5T_02820 [Endozoicomonas sp.]